MHPAQDAQDAQDASPFEEGLWVTPAELCFVNKANGSPCAAADGRTRWSTTSDWIADRTGGAWNAPMVGKPTYKSVATVPSPALVRAVHRRAAEAHAFRAQGAVRAFTALCASLREKKTQAKFGAKLVQHVMVLTGLSFLSHGLATTHAWLHGAEDESPRETALGQLLRVFYKKQHAFQYDPARRVVVFRCKLRGIRVSVVLAAHDTLRNTFTVVLETAQ